jgi:hypothetical protein
MNKYFKEVITLKSLNFKLSGHSISPAYDAVIAQSPNLEAQFKNVCAPVPLDLVDDLEKILAILNISKRQFLTLSIESAIDEAKAIMDDINIGEYSRSDKEAA